MVAANDGATAGYDDSLILLDGRRMGWRVFGEARSERASRGPVVIALHGTPGSRLKFSSLDKVAKAAGVCVIAPDRWGYGLTDEPDAPSLKLFAQDIHRLIDVLGIDKFGMLGVSGGGPFAAAVAAFMGARVSALALVAPVGPIVGEREAGGNGNVETDVAAGMTPFHKICFLHLPHIPGLVRAVFRLFRLSLRVAPDMAMKVAMARAASADRELMKLDPVRRRLITTFREGLRPGLQGPRIDLDLFGAPWNIPLAGISTPAMLWLGDEDQNVPLNAALELAACVSTCEVTMLPGEGHLWVATHYADVLRWMLGAMGNGRQ